MVPDLEERKSEKKKMKKIKMGKSYGKCQYVLYFSNLEFHILHYWKHFMINVNVSV